MLKQPATVVIERITPLIDGGRYPIKRIIGQDLTVEADIFKDGHDVVAAVLKWRKQGAKSWFETPMEPLINDRWRGVCSFYENVRYEFTIEAWGDTFESWRHEIHKKFDAGIRDLVSESLEGARLVESAAKRAGDSSDGQRLLEIATQLREGNAELTNQISYWTELSVMMGVWPDRDTSTEYVPYPLVVVDRVRASYAAWYEFFPRSAQGLPDKGSTFRDCLERVDDAKAMGFDVIYFPPIHPIGFTKRKGRNNSVTSTPDDPGVPYAIGSEAGGHKAVEPALGSMKDFEWLNTEIRKRGMEIALDFAINCSPDHPYVKEHPDWFYIRPDGTIKYAENPPKKYEDIYPLNFQSPKWKEIWEELKSVILFWAKKGVRIFRVDNPHTKPVSFWEWMINEVQAKYPDVIFLSEAFTRPKMMKSLAKAGFTQSYTYFTWRNYKHELVEYFTELTQSEMKDYFRGNLFPNTPDINPYFLQHGGRPAFMIRAVLASTLSSVYGIYSGFELCESAGVEGKEEYHDSEKYQFKGRDWNGPGNIKDYITRLNSIRRENRALQEYDNLRFYHAESDHVLFYGKMTRARDNIVLVLINLDPYQTHDSYVYVPIAEFGFAETDTYQVHDLLTDERFLWTGSRNYVVLNPHQRPAHVFRVRRWVSREQDFDYFM